MMVLEAEQISGSFTETVTNVVSIELLTIKARTESTTLPFTVGTIMVFCPFEKNPDVVLNVTGVPSGFGLPSVSDRNASITDALMPFPMIRLGFELRATWQDRFATTTFVTIARVTNCIGV